MIIKRPFRRRARSKGPVPSLFHERAPTGLVADVPMSALLDLGTGTPRFWRRGQPMR
jgi:hypothetical protein